MKYLYPLLLGLILPIAAYLLWTDLQTPNVGSEMTGTAWFVNASGQIQAAVSSWGLRVPSLANKNCIGTDGNGVFQTGTCSGGGGVASSVWSWEDEVTNTITPNVASTSNTALVKATAFIASSTATSSTFNLATITNASTTNLSATNLWGALTGNADTATALAANGTNCSAGNAPLGVDASGAVESCFDVWTEAENTSAAYISNLSGFDTDDLTQGATNLYNQTHSGDVTGATTLAIANDVVAFTDIAYSITLAGNPALGASESYFGANGIIFEGSTANTSETLLTVTNPTADRTITFPDASITVAGLTSAMTGTFDGNNFSGGAIGTNEMLYGSSAGVLGEIAAGTSAQFLQADGSGAPGFVTMSGDATIAAGGALTIASDAIEESMLKVVDTAADEECLTYESTTGDFEWQDCGSGGGGTGAGTATTTDINGLPGTSETITYSDNDFYVGGSSSTTAEFNFDPETSKLTLSSSTAATGTIAAASNDAIRLMSSSTPGIEFDFGTALQVILRAVGNITTFVTDLAVSISGTLTATGVVDFGGATSVELPQNTTVNAAGEVTINTASSSLSLYNGSAERILTPYDTVTLTNLASTSIDVNGNSYDTGTTTYRMHLYKEAVTLGNFYCSLTKGGTVLVQVGDGTASSSALSVNTTAEDTSPTNGTFTSREPILVSIGSQTSSADDLTCTLEFYLTP